MIQSQYPPRTIYSHNEIPPFSWLLICLPRQESWFFRKWWSLQKKRFNNKEVPLSSGFPLGYQRPSTWLKSDWFVIESDSPDAKRNVDALSVVCVYISRLPLAPLFTITSRDPRSCVFSQSVLIYFNVGVVLFAAVNLDERLRLSSCLDDYKLQEVVLVPLGGKNPQTAVLSVHDLTTMNKKSVSVTVSNSGNMPGASKMSGKTTLRPTSSEATLNAGHEKKKRGLFGLLGFGKNKKGSVSNLQTIFSFFAARFFHVKSSRERIRNRYLRIPFLLLQFFILSFIGSF